MSQLYDGLIPPHQECPFRGECFVASQFCCRHEGVNHQVEYSCALARAFDIIHKDPQ